MSRVKCATTMCPTTSDDSLHSPSAILPSRPNHFVQTKNLPYSLKEIKITSKCSVCCECKPQFYCPENVPLIKAFQTFKRINIYFKAPPPPHWQVTEQVLLCGARLMSILGFHLSFPVLMCWQAWLSCASLHFSLLYEYQHMSIPI